MAQEANARAASAEERLRAMYEAARASADAEVHMAEEHQVGRTVPTHKLLYGPRKGSHPSSHGAHRPAAARMPARDSKPCCAAAFELISVCGLSYLRFEGGLQAVEIELVPTKI